MLTGRRWRGGRKIGMAAHRFEDLLAMHGHINGCLNAQSHFVAAHFHYRDDDVIADYNSLVAFSR